MDKDYVIFEEKDTCVEFSILNEGIFLEANYFDSLPEFTSSVSFLLNKEQIKELYELLGKFLKQPTEGN